MNKILEKIVAIMLVIVLAGANLSIIGMYGVTYALTDAELAGQTTTTENSNVEFNAYFQGGGHSEKKKYTEATKLFVNIKVKNTGYLKNAEISLQDVNFKIEGDIENNNVQSVDKENNLIKLNQINSGSDVTLEIPISMLKKNTVSSDYFAKETKAVFSGTYVDGSGKERSVSKQITNKLLWELGESVKNSVKVRGGEIFAYTYKEATRIIMQMEVGVSYGKLPVKESKIEVTIPDIAGTKADRVTVVAITGGINGDDLGLNFGANNYTYNQAENKINIVTKNGENEIEWNQDVEDKYIVSCIYSGEAIKNLIENVGVLDYKYTAKVEVEEYEDIKTTTSNYVSVTKEVNNLTTYVYDTNNLVNILVKSDDSISKGQIYANYSSEEKKEVSYYQRIIAQILDAQEKRGEFIITEDVPAFNIDGQDENYSTTLNGKNYIYNKNVKVNSQSFSNLLGENGVIDIYNYDGNTKIGTISKNTTKDNDGNYTLDISQADNNRIKIVAYVKEADGTSIRGPINEGSLIIYLEKAIKTEQPYTLDQMKKFSKISHHIECSATYLEQKSDGTYFKDKSEINSEVLLKDTKSVVELSVGKKDLSTVVKNQNVEIRVTLDTSSKENALYTNPTLKIKLPSYIKTVDLKSSNILMANGLKIKNTEVVTENGAQIIKIELEGNQAEYTINEVYKGTIITLNTDLTLDILAPSKQEKISMEYTNDNISSLNKTGIVETDINIVAPSGLVTANEIENYADGKESIFSMTSESKTETIPAYSEARIATVNGTIVNNIKNKISDVIILGRIPAKGNKKIDTSDELGSTFTTTLNTGIALKGIDSSKYTIYYSENANASKDITDTTNVWDTTCTSDAKSYLIVTNGYEMQAGEKIEFTYKINIPENIEYDNSTYEMYKVYYNNVATIGTTAETKESAIIGMKTGTGPSLKAEISAVLPEGATVREGQLVKMKLVIKNEGTIAANNVKGTIKLGEYKTDEGQVVYENKFVKYETANGFMDENSATKNFEIGTIDGGKSKEYTFWIRIDSRSGDASGIKALANIDGATGSIVSNEYKFDVQEGNLSIDLANYYAESDIISGKTLKYTIKVQNVSITNSLNNIVTSLRIPDGLKYDSGYIINHLGDTQKVTSGISYNESNNTVTFNLGNLNVITSSNSSKIIELELKISDTTKNFSMYAVAKADGIEEHYSNVVNGNAEMVNIEISELSATPKYVKEGQSITYTLKLTNKCQDVVYNGKVTGTLPSELKFQELTYTYNDGTTSKLPAIQDNKINLILRALDSGESVDIKITARAKLLQNKNEKEIKTKLAVSAQGFNETSTNTVTNIIEYNEKLHTGGDSGDDSGDPTNPDNPSNPNNPTTPTVKRYKITGTAWLDSNKNGKREDDETLLPGIKVMLLNKNDNSIVKDADKNTNKITTTNVSGKYEFDNLPNGEYIVVFLYEAGKYSLTTYKAKDVDSSVNSDAIDINITVDGKRTIAGVTDAITIADDNARDIDVGIYTAEKFDLKLDKYISKITLTTPTIGTKTYTYDNSQIGKIEVLGSSLGKSNAVIEYRIVVTNEGAIPGYVKKIVDYLPQNIGFNTELNKDWYLSENGNVYNESLANTIINPGESKEVTLVVTKKITENSLGLISNSAEIYECYNEQGQQDIDSTPGNKVTEEDDMSNADVMISIVTGKIITYTTIALGVITLLGFGIFEIKKRVLSKNNK